MLLPAQAGFIRMVYSSFEDFMKFGAVSLIAFLVLPAALAQLTPGRFTPTGSMITSRFAHTATLLADGRVLIAGGCLDESGFNAVPPFCGTTITPTAEIY